MHIKSTILLLLHGEWTLLVISLDHACKRYSYTFKPLAVILIEQHLDYLAAQQGHRQNDYHTELGMYSAVWITNTTVTDTSMS